MLNLFLNQYVRRIKPDGDKEILTQEEVYQFLELLVQYLRYNPDLLEKIDTSQVMELSCRLYLNKQLATMDSV
jgi:hypothetical protein